jgi:hypothetical protein
MLVVSDSVIHCINLLNPSILASSPPRLTCLLKGAINNFGDRWKYAKGKLPKLSGDGSWKSLRNAQVFVFASELQCVGPTLPDPTPPKSKSVKRFFIKLNKTIQNWFVAFSQSGLLRKEQSAAKCAPREFALDLPPLASSFIRNFNQYCSRMMHHQPGWQPALAFLLPPAPSDRADFEAWFC